MSGFFLKKSMLHLLDCYFWWTNLEYNRLWSFVKVNFAFRKLGNSLKMTSAVQQTTNNQCKLYSLQLCSQSSYCRATSWSRRKDTRKKRSFIHPAVYMTFHFYQITQNENDTEIAYIRIFCTCPILIKIFVLI